MRPLQRLQKALDSVEHGDYQVRLPQFRLQEFNSLAQRFNHMVGQLEQTHRENHRLLEYAITVQEEERRHVTRELHDELGQCLTAIKAEAQFVISESQQQKTVVDSASAIAEIATHVYDFIKTMMRRLRPSALDELGLQAALEDLLQDWQRHHATVEVDFSLDIDDQLIDQTASIHIYRIVQECLTNTAKYAEASTLEVTLQHVDDQLQLHIADNGQGFDVKNTQQGIGLLGIRERVELLAGEMQLSSGDSGTVFEIALPLQS